MREIVYQFSNPSIGINFFTASTAERDNLINTQPDFNFLGASYFTADPANDTSSAVFRLFDQDTGSYFYTTSTAERDSILSNNSSFSDEGTAFNAFTTPIEETEEVYRFFNPNTDAHFFTASETERQSLEENPNFQFEQIAFYTPPITSEADTPPSEDPIAARGTGVISGFIFNDVNRSGVRDSDLVQGENPNLIFVIDVSGSSEDIFDGTPVGDINGDGVENTILDAELDGFIALNQQLIDQGLADNTQINIVLFGDDGVSLNMIPGAEDPSLLAEGQAQTFTINPNTDSNGNGIFDVEEILGSVTSGSFGAGQDTNFAGGLIASQNALNSIGTVAGEGNIIFLSDGANNFSIPDELLSDLDNSDVNVSAFGVGEGASLDDLRQLDPLAQIFTSTDEFRSIFGGDDEQLSLSRLEPPQQGIEVYLDRNNNGIQDVREPVAVTDANGVYQFTELPPGTYIVRQADNSFEQTFPVNPTAYTVELEDGELVGDRNFGNASIARDNFTGANLQVQGFSPDLNTPITTPISTVVGDGLEINNIRDSALDNADIVDLNIDISASNIGFTIDVLTPNDDGRFDSASFNGYRFRDFSNSVAPITSVTINQDGTTLGFNSSDIDFTADIIEVDFSGVTYEQGDTLSLDIEFG